MSSAEGPFELLEAAFVRCVSELHVQTSKLERAGEERQALAGRAERAEAARDAAVRAAGEARGEAGAAGAGAAHAAAGLLRAQEDLLGTRMRLEIADRERTALEERCCELSAQLSKTTRELELLRAQSSVHAAQQAAFRDLQQRTKKAAEEFHASVQRLEAELRRVERSAGAGMELRERARLAAAAHVRERQLADAELRHTTTDLLAANAEIVRLTLELKDCRNSIDKMSRGELTQRSTEEWQTTVNELRSALETERAGAARLERALASVAADNAALSADAAANVQRSAAVNVERPKSPTNVETVVARALPNIKAVDSFLEE